jgi:hypothetical protein
MIDCSEWGCGGLRVHTFDIPALAKGRTSGLFPGIAEAGAKEGGDHQAMSQDRDSSESDGRHERPSIEVGETFNGGAALADASAQNNGLPPLEAGP